MSDEEQPLKRRVRLIGEVIGVIGALPLVAACAQFNVTQGVDNRWRVEPAPEFVRGATTQSQVLEALGPPSQILSLNKGTAFYYLREHGRGNAAILILYNTSNVRFAYDRAVFFFDDDGLLTDFSYSAEQVPRE